VQNWASLPRPKGLVGAAAQTSERQAEMGCFVLLFLFFFFFLFFLTSEGGFGPKLDRGASAQNSIEELIAFAHGVQRLGATKMLGAS
jgi:hypothetical protein